MEQKLSIEVEGAGRVSGLLSLPEGAERSAKGLILAHGAGGNMHTPILAQFARELADAGHPVLRFNFPYAEEQRRAPDRPPVLASAWLAARRAFATHAGVGVESVVAAGKSMGGRIASELVASGRLNADALVLLGYPLHPAGRPERLRDAHLKNIKVPTLFFAGTRDPLCQLDLLRTILDGLEMPWTLEVVEGGDHSFNLPKPAGVPAAETCKRLADFTKAWLSRLAG